MGLIEKARSLVSPAEEKRFNYKCGDCDHTFESPVDNPNDTSCPECGSERVHTAL